MRLATDRVEPALQRLSWARQWKSHVELAQGVIDVVNNNMEQAIRLISVERGYDPRDFTLFCFGGAGGLHAASLARSLGMKRVVVPRFPGALSALGLLLADVRKDYSRTLLLDAMNSTAALKTTLADLHKTGLADMQSEGFRKHEIQSVDFVDLRYRGQSYELTVKAGRDFVDRFHDAHERRYGYANRGRPVELVNARTTFIGRTAKPDFNEARKVRARVAPLSTERVWIDGKQVKTAIYDRASLGYGHTIDGPAIIGEYSSTTLVPPRARCVVDEYLNLVLEVLN
jgi:N-methylhydantoinase A